jgi:Ca2+-binding EF-hand superfamily protein
VFSSEEDDCLSFEDFIDLVSVFSENADIKLKSTYAFQMFGE